MANTKDTHEFSIKTGDLEATLKVIKEINAEIRKMEGGGKKIQTALGGVQFDSMAAAAVATAPTTAGAGVRASHVKSVMAARLELANAQNEGVVAQGLLTEQQTAKIQAASTAGTQAATNFKANAQTRKAEREQLYGKGATADSISKIQTRIAQRRTQAFENYTAAKEKRRKEAEAAEEVRAASASAKLTEAGAANWQEDRSNRLQHKVNSEKVMQDKALRLKGDRQSQADLITTRLNDRGTTQSGLLAQRAAERVEEHKRRQERRQWRLQDRAEQKSSRQEEKANAQKDAAGGLLLGALPGGGLLQRAAQYVSRLSPNFGGGMQRMAHTFGAWGSQPVRSPLAFQHTFGGWGGSGVSWAPGAGYAMGDAAAAAGGGAVLGVAAGAGLTYKMAQMAHGAYSGSTNRVVAAERALRLGAGMGGGVTVQDSLGQMGAKDLAAKYGVGPEESIQAYNTFLKARGATTNAEGAKHYLDTSFAYGMDPGRAGRYAAGGKSAESYSAMASSLRQAGVSGDALDAADASISDRLHANKMLGLDYSITGDAGVAASLANKGFGGGQYGGVAGMRKMQGLGTNIGDSIRSSIGQMADVLSFAEAARGGGDMMQIVERNRQMGAAENLQALSRGSSADSWAKWGKGFSRAQATGQAAELPAGASGDPGKFATPSSSIEAKQDAATLSAASQSQMLRALQNMDNNIEWFKTRILTQFSGAVSATSWAAAAGAGAGR